MIPNIKILSSFLFPSWVILPRMLAARGAEPQRALAGLRAQLGPYSAALTQILLHLLKGHPAGRSQPGQASTTTLAILFLGRPTSQILVYPFVGKGLFSNSVSSA